jgi:hypothetical protein
MRPCHWCGAVFFICRCCDRGHAYCSDECRHLGRTRSKREARARHQSTPEGRADHRDAMREHRAHQHASVTDQGFDRAPVERRVAPEEVTDAMGGKGLHPRAVPRCIVCGGTGRFARWWPSPAMRRQR